VSGLRAPTLELVRRARAGFAEGVLRTPLIPVETDAGATVRLKLENLQPTGAFKIRGVLSKLLSVGRHEVAHGIYTASAGNMAQAVAYAGRLFGIPAKAYVPETAPRAKTDAVARLGARVVPVPYEQWWQIMEAGGRAGERGLFVHPFADTDVMAGNGTIAIEIVEEFPDLDAVLVPWGGGGLTCGIAAAMKELNPDVRVYACEVDGAAPLSASLAAGAPVRIDNRKTFIDGIGGRGVFPEMWPLAQQLVSGALLVSEPQVAEAVGFLAKRAHVVAEGAGAVPVAAALHAPIDPAPRRIVCVVSGGNIDASVLGTILGGSLP